MTNLPRHPLRFTLHLIAASALLTGVSSHIHAQTSGQRAGSVRPSEPVTLNFANADIEAVARTMATITGKNVVVDPRVKGQITLVTENAVQPNAAFQQFLAALRLQGFTVVESAGLYKVVPEADAKLQTGNVSVSQGGAGGTPAGGQVVTQIFKLNFENAANLVPVLRPLISPNNTINVNPGNNSLVITDYADNLQRLARIVAAMDVSNASDVEVIPLQHAIATDLAPLVSRLIEGGSATATGTAQGVAQGQTDNSFKTTLLAEPRSNALIVRAANPARVALVRSLVAKLDQPAAPGSSAASGNIHVVYLKNADAVKLATTLRAALGSAGGSGTSSGGGTGTGNLSGGLTRTGASGLGQTSGLGNSTNASGNAGGLGSSGLGTGQGSSGSSDANQPSTGGIIQADPTTNSLIISAPEPLYRQIRAVIDKLDGRRAQVLIESLIVEVSANKVAEFGIQWQGVLGNYGSTLGVLGNNSSVAGRNILDLALAAATGNVTSIANAKPAAGMNLAVAPRINGKYYLGALANFLENTGDANVLSTPNLLTLDNEEAQIIIGNNVPFVTGSYANTGGSGGAVNPFTTVERKDVGLMLRVRPQINENGTVKLTMYQEVSKVAESTLSNANGPSTSKRSIESTVLVDDGSVIVIGGLLEDSYALGQDKVPVMGDLPVVGGLFRNEKRTRQKTNLMVFLRPMVIRDSATSDALMVDRYEAIRALQQSTQPAPSTMMSGVSEAPVLPPLPAPASSAAPVQPAAAPAPLAPLAPQPPARTATPPSMGQSPYSPQ
ncbi:type II secretion system secretin GspD [Diaphorobacter sp. C33]|uniref:General secretion pathway protein D n=1 Tax=Diaphorobacter nitroreducens TaxID=164759 RepID=A0AAX1WZ66_9BURK|nr:type II secretion system secretin GspD [Diaphorobacter sp. C33]ROR50615.1 general secretion pathway protein D [Diaphorobacter nitroreducens]WKK89539.1 type II secretion system secretin GspD [Diaphorobacter sp. C33]